MRKTKPVLVVLAGPNGSGKTTLTSAIKELGYDQDCEAINPDLVAKELFGDWNDPDAVKKAADWCDNRREQLLKEKKNIFLETVFSSPVKLDFVKRAKEYGYFIRFLFVCTTSPDINASRVSRRYRNGGHTVPIEKIVSRYYKSLQQAQSVISIVDRGYFIDNSKDLTIPELVFQTRNGTVHKIYTDNVPSWAETILGKVEQVV